VVWQKGNGTLLLRFLCWANGVERVAFDGIKIVKMHIDSYQFGKIVVDGEAYGSDLIIVDGAVRANWWRKQGHSLSAEDLKTVIAAKPAVLIVGCGASGLMKVPDETRQALQEHNIQLEALDTGKAVQRFNELSQEGTNVAAALHLTC
jgi:hypothetical protein